LKKIPLEKNVVYLFINITPKGGRISKTAFAIHRAYNGVSIFLDRLCKQRLQSGDRFGKGSR
ncbi:hypothetical protein KKB28_04370, partial [bacterium]|nr:hypothetical protein [bacterium]